MLLLKQLQSISIHFYRTAPVRSHIFCFEIELIPMLHISELKLKKALAAM